MDTGDLSKFTDRELLLLTAQEVSTMKVDQKSIREEFKSTCEAFHEIASSCKSEHRQDDILIRKRISALENYKNQVVGALLVISALLAWVFNKISKVI